MVRSAGKEGRRWGGEGIGGCKVVTKACDRYLIERRVGFLGQSVRTRKRCFYQKHKKKVDTLDYSETKIKLSFKGHHQESMKTTHGMGRSVGRLFVS